MPGLVSIKFTICVGMVERQATSHNDDILYSNGPLLLVWYKDGILRDARSLGPQVPCFLYVLFNISDLNMVFFE